MAESARQPTSSSTFDMPPAPRDALGALRRIGIEAEFVGLSAREAAQALAAGIGGTLTELDPHAFLVRDSPLGHFVVELDIRYVHPLAHGETLAIHLGPRTAAWLGTVLSGVVPRELITGPIPLDRLADADIAIRVLHRAGATGHGSTWAGSLGLHYNVEPPRLDARTLVAFLKAYLLLEPWLRQAVAEAHRRLAPVLALRGRVRMPPRYPADYVRRMLAPGYWPELDMLSDDYLAANPTRDRGLDLLPILLHFDEPRVRAILPHEKIGARPVLHYRLPHAYVGEPGWSIAPDWNRWLAVERLAEDEGRLGELGQVFLSHDGEDAAWMRIIDPIAANGGSRSPLRTCASEVKGWKLQGIRPST